MEYAILAVVLLGALYLLVRFSKTEADCQTHSGGCEYCSRIGGPPAERLYQIDPATPDIDAPNEKPRK